MVHIQKILHIHLSQHGYSESFRNNKQYIHFENQMVTNNLLIQVARSLRYQRLPQIIGTDLCVDTLPLIFDSLANLTRQHLSIQLEPPDDVTSLNRRLVSPIGKYGLIDFEYPCAATVESLKTDNVKLLREFGFVGKTDKESDDLLLIDDDLEYCIRQIHDDISENQIWLKLFFHTTNVDFSKLGIETRLRQTYNPELIQFPLNFRCVDACLTNAPFIWFHRYFYL